MREAELEKVVLELSQLAREEGLDFYPMRFELCPSFVLQTLGAYGMLTRFSHWSFGKAYQRLKWRYDLGLNRVYEMVVNTNPCYAFLYAGNRPVEHKLVVAHALAHSDFFKHNLHFRSLSGDWHVRMSCHARCLRSYAEKYGSRLEELLDAALVLQEHVDPYLGSEEGKDLLLFLVRYAPELEDWERDVLSMVREESLYFWPQFTTKILNEGWATYWHVRLLRRLELEFKEAVEFARLQAKLLSPGSTGINPYLVGLRILEDIERRYGRDKLFEVRLLEDDLSLIRNYLTPKLVEELGLSLYRLVGEAWRPVGGGAEKVKEALIKRLTHGGFPYLVAKDGNYGGRGELYLVHVFDGRELDVYHLERALPHVYRLWRRPVHLETVLEGRRVRFTYTGHRVVRQSLTRKAEGGATGQPAGQEIEE
ncbi:SpoVR family protein [Ammonifex thiophilus]|uniref:Stage V sporulation protein R n=1 Tax=Ammonifex thiophilus TaxID=444093 RepID=A0A3D8P239_9THEO|nr:SpoVR family protein [Ammonifex thiophilus]RDV82113.1 stage V sporulation protein R [Ammonifex thiophilus]